MSVARHRSAKRGATRQSLTFPKVKWVVLLPVIFAADVLVASVAWYVVGLFIR
jgi:hypothetical protein